MINMKVMKGIGMICRREMTMALNFWVISTSLPLLVIKAFWNIKFGIPKLANRIFSENVYYLD